MEITFWGVRGSIASPGEDTVLVGGNTSCVEVRCGDERIVLDAGTGLRGLGARMMTEAGGRGAAALRATVLLSHYHWDHIQGLPFFVPLYVPGTELRVVGQRTGLLTLRETLAHQMSAPVFPVRLDEIGARLEGTEALPGADLRIGEARVRTAKGNHPGGVLAYRVDFDGRSVVYATDTEPFGAVDPALVRLAEGADVLVHDAQYTPAEYPSKVGWGHSTYLDAAALAREAGVDTLVLYHHDPARDDAGVLALEAAARAVHPRTVAAREGGRIELAPGRSSRILGRDGREVASAA